MRSGALSPISASGTGSFLHTLFDLWLEPCNASFTTAFNCLKRSVAPVDWVFPIIRKPDIRLCRYILRRSLRETVVQPYICVNGDIFRIFPAFGRLTFGINAHTSGDRTDPSLDQTQRLIRFVLITADGTFYLVGFLDAFLGYFDSPLRKAEKPKRRDNNTDNSNGNGNYHRRIEEFRDKFSPHDVAPSRFYYPPNQPLPRIFRSCQLFLATTFCSLHDVFNTHAVVLDEFRWRSRLTNWFWTPMNSIGIGAFLKGVLQSRFPIPVHLMLFTVTTAPAARVMGFGSSG